MCKLFAMTNMENIKVDKKFINVVKGQVCKSTDRDGFGFAMLDASNNICGEKTTNPFKYSPLGDDPATRETNKLPFINVSEEHFGTGNYKKPKAFIAHGRLSTNTISIENTHPFVSDNFALAHNGVVDDNGEYVKELLKTDCDSEILEKYWSINGMDAIEEHVSGYYALLVLDNEGKLHIVRDDRASLYMSWSSTVQSFIVATTEDIIKGVAGKMRWRYEKPELISQNTYAVFQGNKVLSSRIIKPLGMLASYDWRKAQSALGNAHGTEYMDGSSVADYYNETGRFRAPEVYEETSPTDDDAPSYRELMAQDELEVARKANKFLLKKSG